MQDLENAGPGKCALSTMIIDKTVNS